MKTKVCVSCSKRKKLGLFNKSTKSKNGFQSSCRSCQKEYSKRWFQTNKARVMKDKRPYKRAYAKTPRGRYHKYTESAKKRGIIFSLSFEDFESIVIQPCKYCGDYSDNLKISGVDRIDSDKGYEISNCIPCCTFCNQAKSDYSVQYFLEKAKKIVAKL